MKECTKCGSTGPFGKCSMAKDGFNPICKTCQNNEQKVYRLKNLEACKKRVNDRKKLLKSINLAEKIAYLVNNPCVWCGETNPEVLEFDHLRDKKFEIGEKLDEKHWIELEIEIQKCQVLCVNCHQIRGGIEKNAWWLHPMIPKSYRHKNIVITQEWYFEYILDKSCEICGTTNWRAFQLDHKIPSEKTAGIGTLRSKGKLLQLQEEIKKCRVLCANCHKVVTLRQRGI